MYVYIYIYIYMYILQDALGDHAVLSDPPRRPSKPPTACSCILVCFNYLYVYCLL